MSLAFPDFRHLHSSIASHIKQNYDNINPFDVGNVLGVEFMTPAVTSAALTEMLTKDLGGGAASFTNGLGAAAVRINNPHVRYFDSNRHGYSTVRFTRTSCEWVAYAVDKGLKADSASRQAFAAFRKQERKREDSRP